MLNTQNAEIKCDVMLRGTSEHIGEVVVGGLSHGLMPGHHVVAHSDRCHMVALFPVQGVYFVAGDGGIIAAQPR